MTLIDTEHSQGTAVWSSFKMLKILLLRLRGMHREQKKGMLGF